MPPSGPAVHGLAAEQKQWRFVAHCWSAWQGAPISLANTMMKPVCVLVALLPIEPKAHRVTSYSPGSAKVWDGVTDGSSDVPSLNCQRYWLKVVVVIGTNWTAKGAVPVQDGTAGSNCRQSFTVKSTSGGGGPTSAGGARSGGALSGPASTSGNGLPWQEASRMTGRRTRQHICPLSMAR